MAHTKLLFGCGYLGERLARRWRDAGHRVLVVTRSPAKAERLAIEGLAPIIADLTSDDFAAAEIARAATDGNLFPASTITTVLFAIGYDRASSQPIESVYPRAMAAAINLLGSQTAIERFIYISTTGLYSQSGGEAIDEASPTAPQRPGGKASLAAEQILRDSRFARQAVVLRLAGIYGPGRIPRAADLQAGRPIDAPQTGYLNLIHVDDAVATVLAAEERASSPLYLVSDGKPPTRKEYYEELARLLGAPPVQFVEPAADSPASQRAAADKRIDNSRMLRELGVRLAYPSYREGLAAIVGG